MGAWWWLPQAHQSAVKGAALWMSSKRDCLQMCAVDLFVKVAIINIFYYNNFMKWQREGFLWSYQLKLQLTSALQSWVQLIVHNFTRFPLITPTDWFESLHTAVFREKTLKTHCFLTETSNRRQTHVETSPLKHLCLCFIPSLLWFSVSLSCCRMFYFHHVSHFLLMRLNVQV